MFSLLQKRFHSESDKVGLIYVEFIDGDAASLYSESGN